MSTLLMNFVRDESGQDLAEYALLLVLVSVALAGILVTFRDKIQSVFEGAVSAMTDPGSGD